MAGELDWLREQLENAIGKLKGVTHKRMFGCDCYFADSVMFAMVWKEGRIGYKLRDASSYEELRKVKGTDPWRPSGKTMGGWLLLPAEWNEDDDKLASWGKRAHAESREPKRAGATKSKRKRPVKKKA